MIRGPTELLTRIQGPLKAGVDQLGCAYPACEKTSPLRSGAYEAAGHGAGVFTLLEDWLSGNERGDITFDALYEAAATGRHVVNEFGHGEPQPVEVD